MKAEDPVDAWIAASTRDGTVTLRNASSSLWATVAIVGMYGLCNWLLGPSILSDDSDPMGLGELLATAITIFIGSVLAYLIVVWTRVEIRDNRLLIMNPLRQFRLNLSDVRSIEVDALGYAKISLPDREVRILGIENSSSDSLSGGSNDFHALKRLHRNSISSPQGGASVHEISGSRPTGDILGVGLLCASIHAVMIAVVAQPRPRGSLSKGRVFGLVPGRVRRRTTPSQLRLPPTLRAGGSRSGLG
jgi:hypothetical protein